MEMKSSRGGAKPAMLSGATDWALKMADGFEKRGIYEFNARTGELARRVELPQWLADERARLGNKALHEGLASGTIKPPREEIGESRGHIYVVPDAAFEFVGSAVGLDEPIFQRMLALGSAASHVRFVAYDPYYKPAFQWRMKFADFAAKAKLVETKAGFMPQRMVWVGDAALFVAR